MFKKNALKIFVPLSVLLLVFALASLSRNSAKAATNTATPTACPYVTGYVRVGSTSGAGLANVVVTGVSTTDSTVGTGTTDSSGLFGLSGCGRTGMVLTPVLSGYTFSPATQTYTGTGQIVFVATAVVGNLPDLTVLSITEFGYTLPTSTPNAQGCWPSGPYGRLGLRVTIQNIGAGNAGAFVLDLNGVQQVVGSLAANQTLAVDFTGISLTRTRTATVDITNIIAESNETNNVYTLALSAATPTRTGTVPPQVCLTRTPTPTNGPSSTVTRTPTFTLTVIKTPTYTPTQVDRTATLWASSTPSRTPTPATNTPTRTPTSTPTCGCGMFAVQLLSNGPDSNQQTAFNVKLINYGPAQANISFRIYFTLDGAQVASNYVLAKNYDQSGVAVISGPTLASGSNYYFTVSYGATALAAGGSWEFQTALHLADWSSNYNSANDWWHTTGALPTTYTTWSTIPLYVNGSYAGGGNPQP